MRNFAQNTPEHLVKSKAKKLTIFAYPEEGVNLGKRYKKLEASYNRAGREKEYIVYKEGKIEQWEKSKWDKANRLTEQAKIVDKIWASKSDKAKWITEKFLYDEHDNPVIPNQKIKEKDSQNRTVETWFYLNGKIESQRVLNEKGICIELREYRKEKVIRNLLYSDSGKLISEFHYYQATGLLKENFLYEYDSNENLVRKKEFNSLGELQNDCQYTYGEHGNLIESLELVRTSYQNISPEQQESLESGEAIEKGYKNQYTYNDKNLIKEHKLFMLGQLVMRYEYEYEF